MNREYKSVHDAHCCKIHGCKYGDDYCPVFNGDEDGVKCETCYWEENDPSKMEIKVIKQQRDELLAALKEITSIENRYNGGDWDEIEDARNIAKAAISKAEGLQE